MTPPAERMLKLSRLYEVRSQVNQVLLRSGEQDKVLAEACRIAVQLGRFRSASVWMIADERSPLREAVRSGEADSGEEGDAARDAVSSDKHVVRGAVAAFPIRVAHVALGALAFRPESAEAFDEEETALLAALAADVGHALERIEVEAQRDRAELWAARNAERLRLLHEVDRGLIAGDSPEAIARAALGPLRDLLGAPRAIVNLFDLAAGEVEWLAAIGRSRMHVGPGVRYPLSLMGDLEALKRGEPQVIDTHALPASEHRDALLASGVERYMAVPMIVGGELIGALSFGGAPGPFPEDKVAIAREVADQMAIAISHARLRERVERHAVELEHRVRERTAQLQAIAETATDAIVTADARGRIVYLNRGAERMFGYLRQELQGQPLTTLMHDRLRAAHRAGFERFLATGESRVMGGTVELVAVHRSGADFPIELSLSSWASAEGLFFTAILRDISARKDAERRIVEHSRQLEAANKELESFSYSVSHDLRAPLRAVDGFSRMLEERYAHVLDGEGRRLLKVVRDASRGMGALIDDLLTFSRFSRRELLLAEVDMAALAAQALAEVNGGARAAVRIEPLPATRGDRKLLKHVWSNLLSNALKFSAKRAAPLVEVTGNENAGECVYCVSDNGAGFDMRYYDKLFGVFQRLHSAADFPGTGVGLAIVQRIVARHGGRVWAEARVDAGAKFFFSLPPRRAEQPKSEANP